MEEGSSPTGGGTVDKGRAEQYKGRVTVHVIIACIVAATGGSLFGYDVGISGSVLIPSLSKLHSKVRLILYSPSLSGYYSGINSLSLVKKLQLLVCYVYCFCV